MTFQQEKQVVAQYFDALEQASPDELPDVLATFCATEYSCHVSYPWRMIETHEKMAADVWQPLQLSLTDIQRRQDIFFAGTNDGDDATWVVSMGHFMGLFDQTWLDIPPTHRLAMLRYAEFNEVKNGKIVRGGLFFDLLGFMRQAGIEILPNDTGNYFVYPGPRTHDGILTHDKDPSEGTATLALLNRMIEDLDDLNKSGNDRCPPELLSRTWDERMVWYGPAGIGASYTIPRYQQQHQYPFREGLKNKVFNGHVCRVAEGNYAGFFGWPNLTNTAAGGFLGLPANEIQAEMQVVDIYRREGDRLIENWVIIDLPYWLSQQGLDVFERMRAVRGEA